MTFDWTLKNGALRLVATGPRAKDRIHPRVVGERALDEAQVTARISAATRVPAAGRADDAQRAAERLDAIGQALQAGSARRLGAADAVVGDDDDHAIVARRHLERRRERRGVLRDVRERLGADEVDRGLEFVRQALDAHVELDGHRRELCERRERSGQAGLRRARAGAARCASRWRSRQASCASWIRARVHVLVARGSRASVSSQLRQPPLRPLAQARLQPAPLLVGGDEQTPPRRRQLDHLRRAPRPAARRSRPRAASPTPPPRRAPASPRTASSCTSTAYGCPSRSTRVAERPEPGPGRTTAAPLRRRGTRRASGDQ